MVVTKNVEGNSYTEANWIPIQERGTFSSKKYIVKTYVSPKTEHKDHSVSGFECGYKPFL